MRRILLIAAMLLFVASAMAADVTITVDVNSTAHLHDGVKHKTVTIGYTATTDIRAFALDINVDSGTNIGDSPLTDFKVGDNNSVSKGYGIFPGRFRDFINPSSPNWQDPNYSPLTPWNAPGAANTGLGWSRIVVELGTLYSGDANKPATSGTLFTFDVNSEGLVNNNPDCNLRVAVEALRGGVVKADGTAATTNLPTTTPIDFPPDCQVPNCVGITRQACIALLAALTPPQSYTDVNVAGTGQPVEQVLSTVPAAGANCTGTVQMTVVSYPIKATSAFYANWVNRGKPACWAYPRQCNGDGDGKKLGTLWVSSNDLGLLKSAISKTETQLKAVPGAICSDYNHKKLGTIWVASDDLSILKSYISKLETAMIPQWGTGPTDNGLCGNTSITTDPNYHYWCLPTGVTCPPGQTCAPAGTCPNTP